MRDAIVNFHTQFEYEPKMENAHKLKHCSKIIIAGMGGSNLVADLLKIRDPRLTITTHRDYGYGIMGDETAQSSLYIVSSYSGNTEETLHFLRHALAKKFPIAVVTSGGKLLKIAKARKLPFIQIPETGIQPRMALGFGSKAILKLMGREDLLSEISKLSQTLHPSSLEKRGKLLAGRLRGYVPIIYSSNRNSGIAYNWKIKLNETGKIPAFWNVIPELNHNEMTGFDVKDESRHLSQNFHFIILKDKKDALQIQRRMCVLKKLYIARGLPVETVFLKGRGVFHALFSSLILADWTAYYTAKQYNLEPEQVPMIEEFKRLIN